MRVGSLFTGYDGLGMGLQMILPQAKPAWFVEFDAAPSKVLAHHWPDVPNLGDITKIDWAAVPPIDILTGGFPCQDLSHAGLRKGMKPGTRSGLWEHMHYAIDALRPKIVIIENVRGLLTAKTGDSHEVVRIGPKGGRKVELTRRALGRVLWDLADIGYDAQWVGLRASDAVGAPHGRFRVFITAQPASYADVEGLEGRPTLRDVRGVLDHGGPACASPGPRPEPQRPDESGDAVRVVSPDAALAGGSGEEACGCAPWGIYGPAIHRWERVLGRSSPSPTIPGRDGRPRLNPVAVEFMMGLPEGHVTDPAIGLSRSEMLKILGNGVVPLQAAAAISHMILGTPIGVSTSAALLRTPTAQLAVNGGSQHPDKRKGGGHGPTLADEVEHLLPTPQAHDAKGPKTAEQVAEMRARVGAGVRNLNEVVVNDLPLLPTPALRAQVEGLRRFDMLPPHDPDCPGRPGWRGICTCHTRIVEAVVLGDVLRLLDEVQP